MYKKQAELGPNDLIYLTLYASGSSVNAIAEAHNLSERTINLYLEAAAKTLNANHLGHAIALAMATGRISDEEILTAGPNKTFLN